MGLAAAAATSLLAVVVTVRRLDPSIRAPVVGAARAGALAGVLATLVYDAAKMARSQLDATPYDPFVTRVVFGRLLVGGEATEPLVSVAGWAFHVLNGTCFGVAYALLFARGRWISLRRALVTGIGWGLILEGFQLALYPGWLDIRAYDEFARVSALSHLAYGATLGTATRWFADRRAPGDAAAPAP